MGYRSYASVYGKHYSCDCQDEAMGSGCTRVLGSTLSLCLTLSCPWILAGLGAHSSFTEPVKPQDSRLDRPPSAKIQTRLFDLHVCFSGEEGSVWTPGSGDGCFHFTVTSETQLGREARKSMLFSINIGAIPVGTPPTIYKSQEIQQRSYVSHLLTEGKIIPFKSKVDYLSHLVWALAWLP